jgi:hypothetical protein
MKEQAYQCTHAAVTPPMETRAVSAPPSLRTTENRGGFTRAPGRHRVEGRGVVARYLDLDLDAAEGWTTGAP